MGIARSVYLLHCPPHWVKTPPLGLAYLDRYLRNAGIDVATCDLNVAACGRLHADKKEWLRLNAAFQNNLYALVQEKHPDLIARLLEEIRNFPVIGFSLFERNENFSLTLAEHIRQRFPDKTIVFGGPQVLARQMQGHPLSPPWHWVIGEGEKALEEIIRGETRVKIHRHHELDCLNDIPFPDFTCFNISQYGSALPIFASRGCIRRCSFCTEHMLSKKFRQHSPGYIVEQISSLIKQYRRRHYVFHDSLINADYDWLTRLCQGIIDKRLNITWEAQMLIHPGLEPSLGKLMKQSGCVNLFIGMESAADDVLKKMKKGFSKKDAVTFLNILRRAGLNYEISLIFGYPGEHEADFLETVDFILTHRHIIPKIAQINPYIDYRCRHSEPNREGKERVKRFMNIAKKEKIFYTKSFINNLIYA